MINKRGFTLLEVIIAVFFVAATLVAIIEIFNIDFTSADAIKEQLQATTKAQAIMEEISLTKDFNPSKYPIDAVQITPQLGSTMVTVNVSWQTVKSEGTVNLVKEFFE